MSLCVVVSCIMKLLVVCRLGTVLAAVLLVVLMLSRRPATATRGSHAALAPADPTVAECMEGCLRAIQLAWSLPDTAVGGAMCRLARFWRSPEGRLPRRLGPCPTPPAPLKTGTSTRVASMTVIMVDVTSKYVYQLMLGFCCSCCLCQLKCSVTGQH